jgi:hypothetical protein
MSRETERGHRGELTDVLTGIGEGGERSGSKAAGTAVEPAGRLGFLPRRRTDGPPATGRGSLDSRASPGSGGLLRRCFVAANRVAAGERARRSGARLDGEAGRDGAASRARGRPALGFFFLIPIGKLLLMNKNSYITSYSPEKKIWAFINPNTRRLGAWRCPWRGTHAKKGGGGGHGQLALAAGLR